MNNDENQTKGNILGPEILETQVLPSQKNLITIMVLSMTLAQAVLGKNAPKNGKINPGQGQLIIKAIEKTIKTTFPDVAPMILGMFGLELLNLMPLIKDPDKIVKEIIADYAAKNANVAPSNIPGLV